MPVSKEYLDAISKKLDSFNRINGVNPELRNEIFKDDFDPIDHMGKAAIEYMKKRSQEPPIPPDPLFTDHNKY